MAFGWKLYGDGKTPPLGEAVAPDERLSWPLTVGIGAQHVVAMFGATFVFPILMGLDANLAIMMSGIATIVFLLIVQGKVPSYLGTSASFVGAAAAITADGGDAADIVGAILIAGVVLALVGVLIHFAGIRVVNAVLPPAVTGAVIGPATASSSSESRKPNTRPSRMEMRPRKPRSASEATMTKIIVASATHWSCGQ